MSYTDDFASTLYRLMFPVGQPVANHRIRKEFTESSTIDRNTMEPSALWHISIVVLAFTPVFAFIYKVLQLRRGTSKSRVSSVFRNICDICFGIPRVSTRNQSNPISSAIQNLFSPPIMVNQFSYSDKSPEQRAQKYVPSPQEKFLECKKRFLFSLTSPAKQEKGVRRKVSNTGSKKHQTLTQQEVAQTTYRHYQSAKEVSDEEGESDPTKYSAFKSPDEFLCGTATTEDVEALQTLYTNEGPFESVRHVSTPGDYYPDKLAEREPHRSQNSTSLKRGEKSKMHKRSVFSKSGRSKLSKEVDHPISEADNLNQRKSGSCKIRKALKDKKQFKATSTKSTYQLSLSPLLLKKQASKEVSNADSIGVYCAKAATKELQSLIKEIGQINTKRAQIPARASTSFFQFTKESTPNILESKSYSKYLKKIKSTAPHQKRFRKPAELPPIPSKAYPALVQRPKKGLNNKTKTAQKLSKSWTWTSSVEKVKSYENSCSKGPSGSVLQKIASSSRGNDKDRSQATPKPSQPLMQPKKSKHEVSFSTPSPDEAMQTVKRRASLVKNNAQKGIEPTDKFSSDRENSSTVHSLDKINTTKKCSLLTKANRISTMPFTKAALNEDLKAYRLTDTINKDLEAPHPRENTMSKPPKATRVREKVHGTNSVIKHAQNSVKSSRRAHVTKTAFPENEYSYLGRISSPPSAIRNGKNAKDEHGQYQCDNRKSSRDKAEVVQPIEGYILNSKTPIANTLLLCRSGITTTTTYEDWASDKVKGPGAVKACSKAACAEQFPSLSSYLDHLEKKTSHMGRPQDQYAKSIADQRKTETSKQRTVSSAEAQKVEAAHVTFHETVFGDNLGFKSQPEMFNGNIEIPKSRTRRNENYQKRSPMLTKRSPENKTAQKQSTGKKPNPELQMLNRMNTGKKGLLKSGLKDPKSHSPKMIEPQDKHVNKQAVTAAKSSRTKKQYSYLPLKKGCLPNLNKGKKINSTREDTFNSQKDHPQLSNEKSIVVKSPPKQPQIIKHVNYGDKNRAPKSSAKSVHLKGGTNCGHSTFNDEDNQEEIQVSPHFGVHQPIVIKHRAAVMTPDKQTWEMRGNILDGSMKSDIKGSNLITDSLCTSPEKQKQLSAVKMTNRSADETSMSVDLQSMLETAKTVLRQRKEERDRSRKKQNVAPVIEAKAPTTSVEQTPEVSPSKRSPSQSKSPVKESEMTKTGTIKNSSYTHLFKTGETHGPKPWKTRTTKAVADRLKLILQRKKEDCDKRKHDKIVTKQLEGNDSRAYEVHNAVAKITLGDTEKQDTIVTNASSCAKKSSANEPKVKHKLKCQIERTSDLTDKYIKAISKQTASGPPKLRTEALAKKRRQNAETSDNALKSSPIKNKKKRFKSKGTPLKLTVVHCQSDVCEENAPTDEGVTKFGVGDHQSFSQIHQEIAEPSSVSGPLRKSRRTVGIDPAQAARIHQDNLTAEAFIDSQRLGATSRAKKIQSELSVLLGKIQCRKKMNKPFWEKEKDEDRIDNSWDQVSEISPIKITSVSPCRWKHTSPDRQIENSDNRDVSGPNDALFINTEHEPEHSILIPTSTLTHACGRFYSMPDMALTANANVLATDDDHTGSTSKKNDMATEFLFSQSDMSSLLKTKTNATMPPTISNNTSSPYEGNTNIKEKENVQLSQMPDGASSRKRRSNKVVVVGQFERCNITQIDPNLSPDLKARAKPIIEFNEKEIMDAKERETTNTDETRVKRKIERTEQFEGYELPSKKPKTARAIELVCDENGSQDMKSTPHANDNTKMTVSEEPTRSPSLKKSHENAQNTRKHPQACNYDEVQLPESKETVAAETAISVPNIKDKETTQQELTQNRKIKIMVTEDKFNFVRNKYQDASCEVNDSDFEVGENHDTHAVDREIQAASPPLNSTSLMTSSSLILTETAEHEVVVFTESMCDFEQPSSRKSNDASHTTTNCDRLTSFTSGYGTGDGSSSSVFPSNPKMFSRNTDPFSDLLLEWSQKELGYNYHPFDRNKTPGSTFNGKQLEQIGARKVLSHITEESDHSESSEIPPSHSRAKTELSTNTAEECAFKLEKPHTPIGDTHQTYPESKKERVQSQPLMYNHFATILDKPLKETSPNMFHGAKTFRTEQNENVRNECHQSISSKDTNETTENSTDELESKSNVYKYSLAGVPVTVIYTKDSTPADGPRHNAGPDRWAQRNYENNIGSEKKSDKQNNIGDDNQDKGISDESSNPTLRKSVELLSENSSEDTLRASSSVAINASNKNIPLSNVDNTKGFSYSNNYDDDSALDVSRTTQQTSKNDVKLKDVVSKLDEQENGFNSEIQNNKNRDLESLLDSALCFGSVSDPHANLIFSNSRSRKLRDRRSSRRSSRCGSPADNKSCGTPKRTTSFMNSPFLIDAIEDFLKKGSHQKIQIPIQNQNVMKHTQRVQNKDEHKSHTSQIAESRMVSQSSENNKIEAEKNPEDDILMGILKEVPANSFASVWSRKTRKDGRGVKREKGVNICSSSEIHVTTFPEKCNELSSTTNGCIPQSNVREMRNSDDHLNIRPQTTSLQTKKRNDNICPAPSHPGNGDSSESSLSQLLGHKERFCSKKYGNPFGDTKITLGSVQDENTTQVDADTVRKSSSISCKEIDYEKVMGTVSDIDSDNEQVSNLIGKGSYEKGDRNELQRNRGDACEHTHQLKPTGQDLESSHVNAPIVNKYETVGVNNDTQLNKSKAQDVGLVKEASVLSQNPKVVNFIETSKDKMKDSIPDNITRCRQDEGVGNSPCPSSSSSIVLSWVGSQGESDPDADLFSLVVSECASVATRLTKSEYEANSLALREDLSENGLLSMSRSPKRDDEQLTSGHRRTKRRRMFNPNAHLKDNVTSARKMCSESESSVWTKSGRKSINNLNENKPKSETSFSRNVFYETIGMGETWTPLNDDLSSYDAEHDILSSRFDEENDMCDDASITDRGVMEQQSYLHQVRKHLLQDEESSPLRTDTQSDEEKSNPIAKTSQIPPSSVDARCGYVISAWANSKLNNDSTQTIQRPPGTALNASPSQRRFSRQNKCNDSSVAAVRTKVERRFSGLRNVTVAGCQGRVSRGWNKCDFDSPAHADINNADTRAQGLLDSKLSNTVTRSNVMSTNSKEQRRYEVTQRERPAVSLEEHLRTRTKINGPVVYNTNVATELGSNCAGRKRRRYFKSLDEHLKAESEALIHKAREDGWDNTTAEEYRENNCGSPPSQTSLNWYCPQSLSSSNSVCTNHAPIPPLQECSTKPIKSTVGDANRSVEHTETSNLAVQSKLSTRRIPNNANRSVEHTEASDLAVQSELSTRRIQKNANRSVEHTEASNLAVQSELSTRRIQNNANRSVEHTEASDLAVQSELSTRRIQNNANRPVEHTEASDLAVQSELSTRRIPNNANRSVEHTEASNLAVQSELLTRRIPTTQQFTLGAAESALSDPKPTTPKNITSNGIHKRNTTKLSLPVFGKDKVDAATFNSTTSDKKVSKIVEMFEMKRSTGQL